MTSGGAWRGAQKKYISSGIAAAAEIEPSETYRQNATTRTNRITEPRNASGHRTRNIPAAVATPLPPLNLSQMGKQWPARAASAAIIIQVAESCESRAARSTAAEPFATSRISVRIPASGPTTRATFVAPMLPLPPLRTSVPPNNFARISPKGIAPRV